jgi:hypothetical protein
MYNFKRLSVIAVAIIVFSVSMLYDYSIPVSLYLAFVAVIVWFLIICDIPVDSEI